MPRGDPSLGKDPFRRFCIMVGPFVSLWRRPHVVLELIRSLIRVHGATCRFYTSGAGEKIGGIRLFVVAV